MSFFNKHAKNIIIGVLTAATVTLGGTSYSLYTEQTALQTQISQLQNDYDWLHKENEKNRATINKKSAEIQELKGKLSGSSAQKSTSSKSYSPSPSNSRTVYITDTGSKYHAAGCQYLHSSKIAIDINEAKRIGYDACSVCGG